MLFIDYWIIMKYLMIGKICKLFFFAFVGLIAYLALSPTRLGVEPTQLPRFTLEKQLKDIPGIDLNRLKNAHYIELPDRFIEDVAVTNKGDIYVFAGNGPSNFYKIEARNLSLHHKIGQTPGRVLGTAINKQQNMIAFVDEVQGLKIVDLKTMQMKLLVSEFKGKKFISINSVTFSKDSKHLYFTHSCDFSMTEYHYQLLYKTGHGAVYEVNIDTKQVRLIIDGIQFANGITYSQKQDCLYVVQLNLYRILKVPLKQKGIAKPEIIIDNLIGYPDNIKLSEDGNLWIAIPSLRDQINIFLDNTPILRKILINSRIPESIFLQASNMQYSGGIKVDPKSKKVVDYFFGQGDRIKFVTGIVEKNKKIYMASLKQNMIAVVDYI